MGPDHGLLLGLSDDDHVQYLTEARADAWHSGVSHVTDHGGLTGLGDDDHTQYHNDARGDARYSQLGHSHVHTHLEADITDLQSYSLTTHDHDLDYSALGHNHDHGALTGLGDDDHTIYLLADGSRDVSGDLLPSVTATHDLGNSTEHWDNVWTQRIHLGDGTNDSILYDDTEDRFELEFDGVVRAHIKASQAAHDGIAEDGGHADDQEFDGSIGGTAVTPTGTVTWTQSRSRLSVIYEDVNPADMACRLYSLTSPSAGLVVETCFSRMHDDVSNPMVGIILTDGTSTGSNAQALSCYWTAGGIHYTLREYAGTITNMVAGLQASLITFGEKIYMRLEWVSSNTFAVYVSPDGISWSKMGIADNSLTLTPTHMGVFVSNWDSTSSGEAMASFEYLRRVAG